MLQIIGWMGCLYMLARGFDMFAHAPKKEDGERDPLVMIPAAMLVVGAVVFFFMLNSQVSSAPTFPGY